MAGLQKYIHILRLFDETRSEWTVSEIAIALKVPVSTAYRTVREMVAEGMMENANEAHYRLGPFFVEYDRLVRTTDPLHHLGKELISEIVIQARIPCVAVLARLYGDMVMCIADTASKDSRVRTSYERGRPRPLTLGATSKVILAQLPARRLTKLLGTAENEMRQHPFAKSNEEFREDLALIKRRGYSVTRGEVDKGLVGIAAPVVVHERELMGSLSVVIEAKHLDDAIERRLVLLLVSSASLLTEELIDRLDSPERRRAEK